MHFGVWGIGESRLEIYELEQKRDKNNSYQRENWRLSL